jgi:serine/threonine protein kinase
MTEPEQLITGRYRLIEHLGSGGMGVVWRAYDERLHRTVAVKKLLMPSGLTGPQAEEVARLATREGRIAARLHHPNSIMLYDVAEDGGQPYLIMEYLPSRSLSEVLAQRGALPPAEVASIGAQAAAALASAHAVGVVHRDVKPGNVLLGDDGTVKITDFGISRAVEDVTATLTGFVLGTPAYLAPEVAKGQRATFASDVFSLGATLYTAVEGVPPFGSSENAMAQLHRVASEQPRPPAKAGPLAEVLLRLLHTDPNRRPTMAEVSSTLATLAAAPAAAAAAGQSAVGPAAVGPDATRELGQAEARAPAPPTRPLARPAQPVAPAAESTSREDVAFPQLERDDVTSSRAKERERPKRRPAVLAAAAIVLLALAAALLALTLNRGLGGTPSAGVSSGGTPAPTSVAGVSSGTLPPTTAPSATAPATSPPATSAASPSAAPAGPVDSPQAREAAIIDYYALMPGNQQEGWTRLTARYQGSPAGGYDSYQAFWSQMSEVRVSDVHATQGTAVEATVQYTFTSGRVVRERHRYVLVSQDGIWKIDQSTVLSSVTL